MFSFIIFSNVGCNVIAPKILQLNQRDGVIYWCITAQKDVPNAPYFAMV